MHETGFREYVKGALWVYPTAAVAVALAAGSVLTAIHIPRDSWVDALLFQGTADDARNLLIGISGTMMTVIALVLGLTLVALQLSSTQFSPRLLRHFLRDRINQLVLSVFVATFTYATAGLYTVGIRQGQRVDDYPRLAVTFAIMLLFASLIVLVYFVHHVSHSIQIDEVMAGVERRTLAVIEHDLPTFEVVKEPLPDPGEGAVPVPAYRSGYVQTVHTSPLLRVAHEFDAVCRVLPMVGEHVVAGAPMLWVWRPSGGAIDPTVFAEAARVAVRVGYERTSEQDVALGVRQLADIGVKALSPAINDPYTAIQALDHLSVVLAGLTQVPLGNRLRHDGDIVRVAVPGRDLDYYVELATGQIRRYGASEPRVARAVLRVLEGVAALVDEPGRAVVTRHVRLLVEAAQQRIAQSEDLRPVIEHADRILATDSR